MSDTTTTTKPKSHGTLRFNPPPEPAPVWIPRALRNLGILQFGGDYNDPDFSGKAYGWYPMIALRDISVFGNRIAQNESFIVPGNTGLDLCWNRAADFLDVDGRKQREIDFEKAQKELQKPIDWQAEGAFKQRPPNHYRIPEFGPPKRPEFDPANAK